MRNNKGFTLLETLIVILLLAVLLGIGGFLFLVSLRAWDAGQARTGIREDINYAVEKVVRDLKEIQQRSLSQYNSIAQTIQFNDLDSQTYILYLYNGNDPSLDSTYSEDLYELRRADISSGDNPASGEGVLLLRDLVSPDAQDPATEISINGNKITLNIVVQRADETVAIRTIVRPRNL